MFNYDDLYEIGTLGKPHGVKGEIAFRFSDDVFDRADADYLFVEVDGLPVPFFIEEYRFKSDSLALMKFSGVDTADDAQELNGCSVLFERSQTPDDDLLSWAEIIGYTIIDASTGREVGRLLAVDDTTINLLFEVEVAGTDEPVLLPAAEELIADVDRDRREIRLTIPDGLLPSNPTQE